jgi:hypothetical protein
MCAFRQAGHQHPTARVAAAVAVSCRGTGTAGGSSVHQHGAPSPFPAVLPASGSAIAQ